MTRLKLAAGEFKQIKGSLSFIFKFNNPLRLPNGHRTNADLELQDRDKEKGGYYDFLCWDDAGNSSHLQLGVLPVRQLTSRGIGYHSTFMTVTHEKKNFDLGVGGFKLNITKFN
jgi:hypothetical protein